MQKNINEYYSKIGNALKVAVISLENKNMTDDLQKQLDEARKYSQIMAIALELVCTDIAKMIDEDATRGAMMERLVYYVAKALEIDSDD